MAERVITGKHADVMKQLSDEIGFRVFPGDEDVLRHPDVLGVQAGTHTVQRLVAGKSSRVHPFVVKKGTPGGGERL